MCDRAGLVKPRTDPPPVYLDRGEINQGADVIILQLILIAQSVSRTSQLGTCRLVTTGLQR